MVMMVIWKSIWGVWDALLLVLVVFLVAFLCMKINKTGHGYRRGKFSPMAKIGRFLKLNLEANSFLLFFFYAK